MDKRKRIKRKIIQVYYSIPIPQKWKTALLRLRRRIIGYGQFDNNETRVVQDAAVGNRFIKQVLNFPSLIDNSEEYVPLSEEYYERNAKDIKFFAFYLTQYHPTKENDEWWGKGTTEWTNVTRAVPQYLGHNQPRLPDELGYYDLRIKDNMKRQIELARQYGIYGFCFYHYWFDEGRILEKPLNMFLKDKTLDIPFCYCWANHSWHKKFQGTSDDVLIAMPETKDAYLRYIDAVLSDMKDSRYYKINNCPLLIVYRPSGIPSVKEVLGFWRRRAREEGFEGLYIMAVHEAATEEDYRKRGFDASCDFHPTTMFNLMAEAEANVEMVNTAFSGDIYDYQKIVNKKLYMQYEAPKLYRSVMTFWDNTARKNSRAQVYANPSVEAYKKWVKDVITYTHGADLDDNVAFINAWNEWGEGAYLEPDKKWGYALLQKTREAIEESR